MRKNGFFYQYRSIVLLNNWFSLEKMCILLFSITLLISCGKEKLYPDYQTYNSRVDTATLVIKVFNANKLQVNMTTDKMRLLLFDQNNIFYQQINLNGIITPDSTIVLHALPLGHYTALLIVDAPGIDNLNYLEVGKQSFVEVADVLPNLVSATFVATSKNMVLNNPLNNAQLNFQELASLSSETYFDFSAVQNTLRWKNPSANYNLYLLVFQENTLVLTRPIATTTDIKNGIYETPFAQGENYDFLFVDLNATNVATLKNATTTIADIQSWLETDIDNVRMAYAHAPTIANPTENIALLNGITNVAVTLSNSNIADAWTTGCADFNLLIFNDNDLLTRTIPFSDINNPSAPLPVNVFTGNNYTLMAVGNAQAVVNTFDNTTTPQWIATNLQKSNLLDYSWIAKSTKGIISSNPAYTLQPKKLVNASLMTTATVTQIKTMTDFVANPRKITAVVTSTGTADNDLPNLMILQDATGATPIQFTNTPNLQVGDKITIAIQDGSFVTSNNIKYLKDVSYIEFDKSTATITPTDITLAQINTTAIYNQYEYMLVRMTTPVEFRLFKDMTYFSAIAAGANADTLRLRDASVAATTAPDTRNRLYMMLTDKALANIDFDDNIPIGKVSNITGFLVTNPKGNKAILPRNTTSDVPYSSVLDFANQLATRLDAGIVASWTTTLTSSTTAGTKRSAMVTTSTYANPSTMNTLLLTLPTAPTSAISQGATFTFDATNYELALDEDVYFTISASRAKGTTTGGVAGNTLTFNIYYSIDGGTPVKIQNAGVDVTMTLAYNTSSAQTGSFTNIIIPKAGRHSFTISIACASGLTSTVATSTDKQITFSNFSIKQFYN